MGDRSSDGSGDRMGDGIYDEWVTRGERSGNTACGLMGTAHVWQGT